jgi:hypothetical protein
MTDCDRGHARPVVSPSVVSPPVVSPPVVSPPVVSPSAVSLRGAGCGLRTDGLRTGGLRTGGLWLAVLLAGCAGPSGVPQGSAQSRADAQTAAACRQRADEVYNMRHRDTIYTPPSNVYTPFSADYAPGSGNRGLSRLYERDSMVSDCERNTGTEGDRTAPGPSGASAGTPLSGDAPQRGTAPPPPGLLRAPAAQR